MFQTPKDPKDYKYVGKSTPRKDAVDIVTGKATFLDDFAMSDLLIGRSLKSPHSHAMIKSIDVEKAKAVPGIWAVLTYKDCDPNWKMGWPPQKPILDKHLRYIGDSVALVAGETEEACSRAMDLIEVEYEVLPAVYDGLSALADDAPQLYGEFEHNVVTPGYPPFQHDGPFWHLVKGDVEKGFEECAYIAEDTVSFNKMCAPAAPEQPGSIVRWDGDMDFTVWSTTQSTFILRIINSTVIPGINLKAKAFNVGGSYGNKQSVGLPTMCGCLLAKATGRPVKYYETKVEQMINHETRLGSQVHAKIGMDKKGVVRAVKAEWAVDTGAFCNATQGQIGVGIGETQLVMAKCPNWDLDTSCVVTNKQPAGIVRGYGGQELNSCLSLLMGRTMREGNLDPVECYKKNYVSDGDVYTWRDGRQWKAYSIDYTKAIQSTADKFGWKDRWKGWGVPTWTSEDGRIARGVGCGLIGNADIGEDNNEVYVRLSPDLPGSDGFHVMIHADVTESGMGQRSNIIKQVAEYLNVPYECCDMAPADSTLNPTGMGLCGSRGTITYGHAVCNACEDLLHKMFEAAQPLLDVNAESMEFDGENVITHARPGKKVPVRQLLNQFMSFTGFGQHLENFSTPNFYIVFLEVEVDKETGIAKVIDMMGGTDCGQIIDYAALEMQCQSGIGSASLDTALFEEHIIDPATGRPLTYDMIEYKWRPFNEFPHFDHNILESSFDTYQFRATGVGEISGAAAASACMQAISNAIGVQVSEYPATPDVILKALGKL